MDAETTTSTEPARSFTRSLSGVGVIILTLSMMSPGVSVLVSGTSVLDLAGTGSVLAFVVGALVAYCQTAMAAELGAAYPTAGYDYASIGHAMGDWAGATCYIASVAATPIFLNTSAIGIAIYLAPLGLPVSANAITFAMTGIITVLALLNIRANEYITGIFMLIEFAALLLVAGVGASHVQPGALDAVLHPMAVGDGGLWVTAGIGAVGIAVNNASWALGGSSQALMFCEDMQQPRTIGRIIMIAFALAAFLEIAPVTGLIVGARDVRAVLASASPFETFLGDYLPAFALKFVSLSIAVAIFNACLAGFVGLGRNTYAMARTELFAPPVNRALMQLTRRTDAPWLILLIIGVTTALATYLPLTFKVLLLSGAYTILTIFYVAAMFIGRRTGRIGRHDYRTPLFPLVPVIGVLIVIGEVIVLWLDPAMGRKSLLINAGIYVASFLYYRFVLMRRPGGWKMIGPEDIDAMAGVR